MRPGLTCSVIIPTYNRCELLDLTLKSLVKQSIPRDQFEVIVVDDGSTDATRSVVDSFDDRLQIRYFFQEDRGFRVAAARNVGIVNADADLLVFIDSGVILHSECISNHILAHLNSVRPISVIGYVYCFTNSDDEGAQIASEVNLNDIDATIARFDSSKCRLDIRERFYIKYGDDFSGLPAPWIVFWTCNVSVERKTVLAAGLFDESFQSWGAEDVDLGYRLHRTGAKTVLCRKAKAIHYPHEKCVEDNKKSNRMNSLYMASKYRTPITSLVPHHSLFTINDVILERNLPDCEEYLADHNIIT